MKKSKVVSINILYAILAIFVLTLLIDTCAAFLDKSISSIIGSMTGMVAALILCGKKTQHGWLFNLSIIMAFVALVACIVLVCFDFNNCIMEESTVIGMKRFGYAVTFLSLILKWEHIDKKQIEQA